MLRMGSAITWWQWPHLCNVIGTKFCFDARHVWTATLCIKQNSKPVTLQRCGQCQHWIQYPISWRPWLQCSMKALMHHDAVFVAVFHKGCNCSVLWRLCCNTIARQNPLEIQDLSHTYLAHHELESNFRLLLSLLSWLLSLPLLLSLSSSLLLLLLW